jgi:hypothetical protein
VQKPSQLNTPEAMHVFVLPNVYYKVACDVKRAVIESQPADMARFRLKERAMADYIFSIYEYTVLDYLAAQSFMGDSRRAKLDEETLTYFTEDLLRNPRLLWYWNPTGGRLAAEYRHETVGHYKDHVLMNPNKPLTEKTDSVGPLGDDGTDIEQRKANLKQYCQ